MEIRDDWFIENGFFEIRLDTGSSIGNKVCHSMPLWTELINYIKKNEDINIIITPDVLKNNYLTWKKLKRIRN